MLVRNEGKGMAFSGALVFPGGKVDAEDAAAGWSTLAAATPAVPERAFWIAAVRETFEEAGVLLARSQGSESLIESRATHGLVKAERQARSRGDATPFAAMIEREKLILAVDQMLHFGHWITPAWAPKRFDTHFFLVAAPVTQRGTFDDGESQEGLWIRPSDAVDQANAGKRTLVPVTRFTLELLASWDSVGTAVDAARLRPIVTVMPKVEKRSDGRVLMIPREAGYLTHELFIPEAG